MSSPRRVLSEQNNNTADSPVSRQHGPPSRGENGTGGTSLRRRLSHNSSASSSSSRKGGHYGYRAGRIDRINVCNFKSYAGEQVIGPFHDFTAVIGPNGAGKSNLMDAISFVVGLSARHLRGSQLRDLVHRTARMREPQSSSAAAAELDNNGGEFVDAEDARDEANWDSESTASVELVYQVDENEETVEGISGEMRFKRVITPNGNTAYQLNGSTVTREIYNKKLESIGVLVKARNFLVFQGDVESLASKNPKSLLEHFEKISGSWELKNEYERLEKEVSDEQERLSFMYKKKRGFIEEKKQAKQQKDEAERYNKYLEHVEHLKVQRALWKLYFIEHDIKDGENELNKLREESEKYTGEQQNKDNLLKEAQKSLAAKKKEVNNAERTLQKGTKTYQEASADLGKAQAELKSQQDSIKRLQTSLKKIKKTTDDQEEDIKKLEKEINAKKRELGAVETEYASALKAATGLQTTPEQQQRYSELSSKVRQQTVELRTEYDEIKRSYDESAKEVTDLETQQRDLQSRKTEAEKERDEASTRLESLESSKKNEEQSLEEDLKRSKELRKQLENDKRRQAELGNELEEVQAQLADAKDSRQKSHSEKQVINAVEDMKRLFSGVFGRMIDLCTPVSSKYNLAVDVAFGKFVDAVVVDTTKTAKECIGYLRQHQMKPQYFFPLDSLRISHPDDKLKADIEGGKYKLLRDVVRCDKEIEDAVAFVCGRTVVSETLRDATELRFERQVLAKVITVEGAVVSKNGSMTGGVSKEENSRAQRWSEKDMQAIQQRRDKLLTEEESLRRRVASTGVSSESIPKKVSETERLVSERRHHLGVLEDDIKQERDTKTARTREIREISKQLKTVEQKLSRAQKTLQEKEGRLNGKQSSIDNIKNTVFADFCSELGISDISEYEKTVMSKEKEFKSRTQSLEDTIKVLENKLEYEKGRNLREQVSKVEKQIEAAEKSKENLETKVQTCKDNVESAQLKLNEYEQKLSTTKEEMNDEEEEVNALKQAKNTAAKRVADVQRKITTQETFLERKRAERHQLLNEARLEQIELPVLNDESSSRRQKSSARAKQGAGEDDTTITSEGEARVDENATASTRSAQLLNEGSQRFSQSDGTAVRKDSERVAEIDFSKMDTHIAHPERMSKADIEKASSEYDDSISKTQLELEQMRPNLKALEQYEEISQRLDQVAEDLENARQQVKDIGKQFNHVKEKRTHLFMSAFRFVSKRIDAIYKELTKSKSTVMGGKARLDLANEEEPFSSEGIRYHAMPPMKKFRDMDQLSGGEKTVAALALMFAIHEFQPAPFFIMDEIDAALDNANVARVSNYLRKRAATHSKRYEMSDRASVSSEESRGSGKHERRRHGGKPLQFIVISLKDAFYSKANSLVGVYRDNSACCSGTLTLDLTQYQEGQQDASETPVTDYSKDTTPDRSAAGTYRSRRSLAQQ